MSIGSARGIITVPGATVAGSVSRGSSFGTPWMYSMRTPLRRYSITAHHTIYTRRSGIYQLQVESRMGKAPYIASTAASRYRHARCLAWVICALEASTLDNHT